MHTDYTTLYEVYIVVGEDKALPDVVGIKATVGNRRHWILSLDEHSVKNECVCVHIILNIKSMYVMFVNDSKYSNMHTKVLE